MKKQKRKQSITLIEMMVVITLIGIVGGALAFNMRGSIQKGKLSNRSKTVPRCTTS